MSSTTAEMSKAHQNTHKEDRYWVPDLTDIDEQSRQLFEEYSKIPPDEVVPHVNRMYDCGFPTARPRNLHQVVPNPITRYLSDSLYLKRLKAHAIAPYGCITQLRFFASSLMTHPLYSTVLTSLTPPPSRNPRTAPRFLDLGCCFGQEIRRLVHDGADPSHLVGSDIEPAFLELGYELFRDSPSTLSSHFIAADIFTPDNELVTLTKREGRFDIVHAASLFHLFGLEKQKELARRVLELLDERPGALVLGRQGAAVGGLEFAHGGVLEDRIFWHCEESWREMWEEIGRDMEGQPVKFEMRTEMSERPDLFVGSPAGEPARLMTFSIRRL